MFNRINNYRNYLSAPRLRCACALAVHFILLVYLSDVSYGEIGHRMSGYPLMVDHKTPIADKNLSQTIGLANLPLVPSSQKSKFLNDAVLNEKIGKSVSVDEVADNETFAGNIKKSDLPNELVKLPPVQSPEEKQDFSSLNSDESVYLAVYLNNRQLTEVLEGKERNGSVYFRLNEIARLFDAIPPKDENAIATAQALEEIFPAKFNYSKKYQALIIEGKGKLPIEQKWAREYQHKMLGNNTITEDTPLVKFDYGLLGRPSVDISASYLKNGREDFNYSFKVGMEALYGTASIFGRGLGSDDLTDLRLSWERLHNDWFIQLGDVLCSSD